MGTVQTVGAVRKAGASVLSAATLSSAEPRAWPDDTAASMALSPVSTATRLDDSAFRTDLVEMIPQLRAFARGLCGRRELADDLTQEALLRAWKARENFEAGTNMRGWMFAILRNTFLSQMRRARFTGEWNDAVAEQLLTTPPSQEHHLEFGDLQRSLLCLPDPQREALILVAAGGFSYEEAADICACAPGTIKSRVSRARATLERMLVDDSCPPRAAGRAQPADATEPLMREVHRLVGVRNRRREAVAT